MSFFRADVPVHSPEEGKKPPTGPDPLPAEQLRELRWRRLASFCLVYGIGWVFVLGYYNLVALPLQYPWPRNTFLFRPVDRYADFLVTWVQGRAPNPYVNPGTPAISTYFPLPYAVLRMVSPTPAPFMVLSYLGITFGAILLVWIHWLKKQGAFWKGDSRWSVVVILTLLIFVSNYPLLWAIDRGNLDPLVMCLMYAALEQAGHGRNAVGGLFLALASAVKGFPFAALLYWIRRRRVFGSVVAVAGLAALVILPAATFEGGVSVTLTAFAKNLDSFRQRYVIGPDSSHYSSDWLNAIRIMGRWFGEPLDMIAIVPWYERVVFVLAGLLVLLALCVVKDTWRELLAIVLIMLIFPNVSNDYKLILLLLPLIEWLTSEANGWRNAIFGVAAALLLLPKHFYFPMENDDASISCIVNPMLLVAMSAVLWPTSGECAAVSCSLRAARTRFLAIFEAKSGQSRPPPLTGGRQ